MTITAISSKSLKSEVAVILSYVIPMCSSLIITIFANEKQKIYKIFRVYETFEAEYAPNEAKQTKQAQYDRPTNNRKGFCLVHKAALPNHQQG